MLGLGVCKHTYLHWFDYKILKKLVLAFSYLEGIDFSCDFVLCNSDQAKLSCSNYAPKCQILVLNLMQNGSQCCVHILRLSPKHAWRANSCLHKLIHWLPKTSVCNFSRRYEYLRKSNDVSDSWIDWAPQHAMYWYNKALRYNQARLWSGYGFVSLSCRNQLSQIWNFSKTIKNLVSTEFK